MHARQPLTTLLLLGTATAQLFESSPRGPDAFTYVQPRNTTILGQYGSSEPVYPSRKSRGQCHPNIKAFGGRAISLTTGTLEYSSDDRSRRLGGGS